MTWKTTYFPVLGVNMSQTLTFASDGLSYSVSLC